MSGALELPEWFMTAVTISLGLVVGSFLNVVIARLPNDQSIVRPRSRCPGCGAAISWYDNIPVVSYLLLRGKCRAGGCRISVKYPVVELMTALLFLAAKLKFGISLLLVIRDWPFLAALVAITFIDLEHRIIPDELSLGGLVLGLATGWAVPGLGLFQSVGGAAFGFSVFYVMAWAYVRMTGRSGLGGGDVKLLAMLGSFLGLSGVFATVLISSVFGSVVGIAWGLATQKGGLMKVAIPYGPFLVVGGLYYYFFGDILWFRFTTPI